MAESTPITVKVAFGHAVREDSTVQTLTVHVASDGSDSIHDVKNKISEAIGGGKLSSEDLFLSFGPNDRKLGRQYKGDPTVDEAQLKLASFSVLAWIQRFPHWYLIARLLPAAPPPPGVAIQKAAATAEQKNPEAAVADARARGEIPKINELPAPWGPKPFQAPPAKELVSSGYLPAQYPASSSPLTGY